MPPMQVWEFGALGQFAALLPRFSAESVEITLHAKVMQWLLVANWVKNRLYLKADDARQSVLLLKVESKDSIRWRLHRWDVKLTN